MSATVHLAVRLPALLAATMALLGCAGVAPQPAASAALGFDDARHLLVRTGFGAAPQTVAVYAALTRREAVERLLRETRTTAVLPPPGFATETMLARPPGKDATQAERTAYRERQARETRELRAWWISEMVATPSPLTERMTLFWHSHFASSVQKVRSARLMYEQNAAFRANALGDFRTLLRAVACDPAMIVYLDGAQNRKGAPNENFARELMELFTLGEGRYGEQDVKEAARAFTGWSIDRGTGRFAFRPRAHDEGVKTIFAKRGNFDGSDVLDLLLARPETAEFIVTKLWREFVGPALDAAEIRRIAGEFRSARYDIKVAMRELLTNDAFFAAANRGALVKSPVDVVVGTLRTLQIAPSPTVPFAFAVADMGQNLFAPPNVKGWPGGDAWINTSTLLARKAFLERISRGGSAAMTADRAQPRPSFDADTWIAMQPGPHAEDKMRFAQRLLLPLPAVTADVAEAAAEREPAALVRAALLDPVYQLE